LVHDIASEEASSANNGGVVDQVEYIVRTCGTDAKKTIKNALGEE
jgi:hypothetical protein